MCPNWRALRKLSGGGTRRSMIIRLAYADSWLRLANTNVAPDQIGQVVAGGVTPSNFDQEIGVREAQLGLSLGAPLIDPPLAQVTRHG